MPRKRSTEAKRRQRRVKREREKGLSRRKVILLRELNALKNVNINQDSIGGKIKIGIKAARGTRRTLIRRLRLIQLSGAQNHRCCYCGQQTWHKDIDDCGTIKHTRWNKSTLEHVVALVHGGSWSKHNLVMACSQCNNSRGEKTIEHFVTLITTMCNIPISKNENKRIKKELGYNSEKGKIKILKTFHLLLIGALFIPELFKKVYNEYDPEIQIKKIRPRRNHFTSIRKRVNENNMTF